MKIHEMTEPSDKLNNNFVSMIDDPFAGAFPTPDEKNACGPCEKVLAKDELAHNPRRYGTGFLEITVSGGDLVLTNNAASPLVIFEEGLTDNGDSVGLANTALTRAETDAYKGGYLTGSENDNFRLRGIGVHVGRPFRRATGALGARGYETFWSAYLERLQAAIIETACIALHHAKDATNRNEQVFELGRIGFHPPQAGVVSPSGVTIGNPLARAYIPFTSPAWSGVFEDTKALSVRLTLPRDLTIEEDTTAPVAALAGDTYLIPVTVELYGHSVHTEEKSEEIRSQALGVWNDMLEGLDLEKAEDRAVAKRIQEKLRGMKR